MSLGRATAVGLSGISGSVVTVEADIAPGLPNTTIVGMGDTAVAQARDRVRAAVTNSELPWPGVRITISLAPAGLHKRGAGFDLAIAVAILAAHGAVRPQASVVLIGELGLDGTVRPVPGVLPCLLAAVAANLSTAVVPAGNLTEASLARGITVHGADRLEDVVAFLNGAADRLPRSPRTRPTPGRPPPDMREVIGQPEARYALELAAAGGHHVAMIGPPGAGKTMLAARLPGILPPLTEAEALEVTAIHSVAGALNPDTPLLTRPPFVDPHHSASLPAMIGGGSGSIRPGSVSLAHRGVLFLDEAPEFRRTVLDGLRQPVETGSVLVLRAKQAARYPARFQLVLAANPCPCAAARDVDCVCPAGLRRRYLARLSGPLMDRIDIRIDVPPVDLRALTAPTSAEESSERIVQRVLAARDRARHRWRDHGHTCNAQASGTEVRHLWNSHDVRVPLLARAAESGQLTARGYDRVLRLAYTAADLAGRGRPTPDDVGLALALRCGEAA